MIRPARYSGTWYPAEKKELSKYYNAAEKRQKALAAVCPHAGWVYSGKTAGKVFSQMQSASLYIMIGPNHRATGAPVSVYPEGQWKTPLGSLDVDNRLAALTAQYSKYAKLDASPHIEEHSLEVLTPFVKMANPVARILPVCMYDYDPAVCLDLARSLSRALKETGESRDAVIIASTDMSHYVTADNARQADGLAIDRILKLDPEGLLETVETNGITMCGSGPAAVAIWAAAELGAQNARLVAYTNSGDVTGDNREVVGYAGLIIT